MELTLIDDAQRAIWKRWALYGIGAWLLWKALR